MQCPGLCSYPGGRHQCHARSVSTVNKELHSPTLCRMRHVPMTRRSVSWLEGSILPGPALLLFLHMPKTGGSSAVSIVSSLPGWTRHCPHWRGNRHGKLIVSALAEPLRGSELAHSWDSPGNKLSIFAWRQSRVPGRLRPGLSSTDVRSFSPPQRFERGAGPRQAGEVCSREGPSAPWPRAPLRGAPCPLHRSCEWPRTVKKNIGASRSPWRPSQVGVPGGDGKPAYFSSVGVSRWARRATSPLDRPALTRTAPTSHASRAHWCLKASAFELAARGDSAP